jgi:hypothetical protein
VTRPLRVLRQIVAPNGRHRPRPTPQPLLRPIEALDQRPAYCASEKRTTLHVHLRSGGIQCLDCRNPAPATAPTGDLT